jgi:hypothetical protein
VSLATLLALTACGGGGGGHAATGEPTALPHRSSGLSGDSSSPSSDGQIDQENPQRFITRWAAVEGRMQNTGKTGPYLALSKGCVTCRTLAHTVAGYYAAGGFIHGGSWRIDSIKMSAPSGGYPSYTVRAHTTPSSVKESSSGRVTHVPAMPVTYQIGLLASGASYTVAIRSRGA